MIMCGLFGFIGQSADVDLVRRLALLAAQRGPDSWGMWIHRQGGGEQIMVHYHRKLDPKHLDNIDHCDMIIGHCRLATSGSIGVIQPLACGSLVIAHNGNFYDVDRIRPTLPTEPKTDCDSEVLGLAIEAGARRTSLLRSVLSVMANRLKCSPTAFLVATTKRLVAFTEGLPLFELRNIEGVYFCSLAVEGSTPIIGAKDYS